jgi:hypothetical protein
MSAGMYTALVHAKTFGKVRAGETFFDFQLNYLSRDYQQKHQLSFFSNTLQFTLGEKTSLWSRGPTAFKCMYISQRNYDREFSSSTVGCAVAQEASVKRASLQIELGGDYKQTKGAINDVTSYKFLAALMVPALVYRLDYDISLSLSYLDPKNQHETRGVEQLVNFLQSISYPWRNNWRLKASLAIIDKNSRDKEHFAYHKQLIQGGISYGF